MALLLAAATPRPLADYYLALLDVIHGLKNCDGQKLIITNYALTTGCLSDGGQIYQ